MKKTICIIIAFIFVLSLTACAGIGDGALYRSESKDGTYGADISPEADTSEPIFLTNTVLEQAGNVVHYDLGKTRVHRINCTGSAFEELIAIIENGKYEDKASDTANLNSRPHFEIFLGGDNDETYYVYSHDLVRHKKRTSNDTVEMALLGVEDGIYDRITDFLGVIPTSDEQTAEPIDEFQLVCEISEVIPTTSSRYAFTDKLTGKEALELYNLLTRSTYELSGEESGEEYYFLYLSFSYENKDTGKPISTNDERFDGTYVYVVYHNDSIGYATSNTSFLRGKIEGIYNRILELCE